MRKTLLYTIATFATLFFVGCIEQHATQNDFKYKSGFSNNKLYLDGIEGATKKFEISANYDWTITDISGFTCDPMSGGKTADTEITATALYSNNSGDTIRLSDLNFKLLSTRFVGLSAHQLPQIILKERKSLIEAISGAKASLTFKTKCKVEDIEAIPSTSLIEASIKHSTTSYDDYKVCTLTITALTDNTSSEEVELGNVSFKVAGVTQEHLSVSVTQSAAIKIDRSTVLLPCKSGGENIFIVNSPYDISATTTSENFSVAKGANNLFTVTALTDNMATEQIKLGEVDIFLTNHPSCKVSIDVNQRGATASPQTIIYYFIGTALDNHYANNINDIITALDKNIQGNSRMIVAYTDSTTDITLYELRYDANSGKSIKEKIRKLSLSTPYDSEDFANIIRASITFAPADKYSLIIGSHGKGWITKDAAAKSSMRLRKMGFSDISLLWEKPEGSLTRHVGDENPTRYDITEIVSAITSNNIKLEYILFDACYMGNIETAYELRNVAKYIIGSPCEIMGSGFPYTKVTPHLFTENGSSYDLDKVCSEYVEHYRSASGVYYRSAAVSVTNTAELDALAAAVKSANSAPIKEDFSLNEVQYYDGINSGYNPVHLFYDLGDLIEKSCSDATAVSAVKEALERGVTSLYHTDTFFSDYDKKLHSINSYCGVSTSAMVDLCSDSWQQTAWYKATH